MITKLVVTKLSVTKNPRYVGGLYGMYIIIHTELVAVVALPPEGREVSGLGSPAVSD